MSNYYEISCRLDSLESKLENIGNVLEIIAEHISEDPNSGAVWCMRDSVLGVVQEISHLSTLTMDYHLELEDELAAGPKKKKK